MLFTLDKKQTSKIAIIVVQNTVFIDLEFLMTPLLGPWSLPLIVKHNTIACLVHMSLLVQVCKLPLFVSVHLNDAKYISYSF